MLGMKDAFGAIFGNDDVAMHDGNRRFGFLAERQVEWKGDCQRRVICEANSILAKSGNLSKYRKLLPYWT